MELRSGSDDDGSGGNELDIRRVGAECVFHLLRHFGFTSWVFPDVSLRWFLRCAFVV